MAYPDADILVMGEEGIVRTEYRNTEHYQITKSFMNNPDGMLKQLLGSPQKN